ncbi:unnamed protein product, partial [Sphagnum balticum]
GLQVQIDALRKSPNVPTIGMLYTQIENKNDCIDYLRAQLERLERNSKDVLSVVSVLERRLEQVERPARRWDTDRDSIQTFSLNKY